ncbi:uncharacterized protein LOC110092395 isoform X5 [Dendrobium catenatum]|uniref:uncharacterized protein LOC110092395 isoform X5 n=1 Tax=Dendrobium catenatum TaxID=906689 RepID=UPI0009F43FF6|nr:uncharacterized protein LOC110092395 isoform X5 [Dendrobium catenatum]
MEGTISLIISNLLSSLERLSQFMPIFTSLAASSSSSSSSTVEEEMIIDVNSMQEGLMEDLSRLLRILQRIQALLHDAAKREVQDKQTKLWLSELRKVAYDAEDVLDQYDYQIIKTQVEGMTTTEEKPSLQRKKVDDDDDDFYGDQLQQISTLPSTLEEFSVDHCERLEYIALPFSSRYLPRLQKVDIYLCHILKSVINLNNLLGTLKVLKLGNCYLLEPNPDEDYDLSYGRVSSEKGIGHVTECPGMREWCQRHGFTYQEDGSKLNLKQVLRLDLDEFPNKDSDNSYDKDCQELDSIKEAILNWSRQRKV